MFTGRFLHFIQGIPDFAGTDHRFQMSRNEKSRRMVCRLSNCALKSGMIKRKKLCECCKSNPKLTHLIPACQIFKWLLYERYCFLYEASGLHIRTKLNEGIYQVIRHKKRGYFTGKYPLFKKFYHVYAIFSINSRESFT